MWRNRNSFKLLVGMQISTTTMGIYQKEHKLGHLTLMFIAALFTIAKLWKQPRCHTTDEWIK
jgi:hypothetical protein